MLVKEARTAGTTDATIATQSASAVTTPTVDRVNDGAPAVPPTTAPT